MNSPDVATDERGARRRKLQLEVQGTGPGGSTTKALIHNLSESGLLIETGAAMALGESFEVTLPEVGDRTAVVVWADGGFLGCRFDSPVPTAAISAALLRAPILVSRGGEAVALDGPRKLPLGTRTLIIAGLASLCWAVVLGAIALITL